MNSRQGDLGTGPRAAPTVRLDLGAVEQECGEPALAQVRRAYAALVPGSVLETMSPVAEHTFAVRAWARREGAEVVAEERNGAATVLRVRRPD